MLRFCKTGDGEEERYAWSFVHLDATVTGLSHDSDSLIINERVLIHFILFFTQNSRQDTKETTKNDKKHRQDVRNSRTDTKRGHSMALTRPNQPLDSLRARTVWYIM